MRARFGGKTINLCGLWMLVCGALSACGRIDYDPLPRTDAASDATPSLDLGVDSAAPNDMPTMDAQVPDLGDMDAAEVDAGPDLSTPDLPDILVTPTVGLATSEAGGTAIFTVALATAPTSDVLLRFISATPSEGTNSPEDLTFTPDNWNVEQTVTVTGVDDAIADGDVDYTILATPASSADPAYASLPSHNVFLTNSDDEMPGLVVMPTTGLITTEDGATTSLFTVALSAEPTSDVVLDVSSSDTGEGTAAPATLTFSPANWNVAQSLSVSGADDSIADGDQGFEVVVHVAPGSAAPFLGVADVHVSATNLDDDAASVVVSPTAGLRTTEAGGTATFTVVLSSEPVADVTISLASDTPSEGTVSPGSVTFTSVDWNSPQTVTVTGVNDHIFDGFIGAPYTIITSAASSADPNYNSLNPADVIVANRNPTPVYFKPTNTRNDEGYGWLVALSADGNTMAASAPYEASNATGIGGNAFDTSANQAGAVFVYRRVAEVWALEAYVKASNATASSNFGSGLALSADGNTLAVGSWQEHSLAAQSGAAYVFTRSGSTWSEQAFMKASNAGNTDFFGRSVSLSADGNTLAVGASGERSNATGVGGNQADNSLTQAGAVYVFTRSGTSWSQQAYVKASNPDSNDVFGDFVALSGDGDTLAVSADSEDSSASGIGGNQADNTLSGSGAVYVFARVAGVWAQQAYAKASNPRMGGGFGIGLSISYDGNTLAVGAPDENSNARMINGDQSNTSMPSAGAVYVFTRALGTWTQEAYIKPFNTIPAAWFGYSTSLSSDGNILAVGSAGASGSTTGIDGDPFSGGATYCGAAYTFMRSSGVWTQTAYIKASNPSGGDSFGRSLAISSDGTTLVVGAMQESSNATGIGGDQFNEGAFYSGAVYVFE